MINRLLIGLGLLTYLAGSPAESNQPVTLKEPLTQLVLNEEKFDLEQAKIIKYADYGSKNIVVYIMSSHYLDEEGLGQYEDNLQQNNQQSAKIKKDIYATLEELTTENNSCFLGVEGFEGEFSEEKLAGLHLKKGQKALIEFIVDADDEDKKSLAELFCFDYGFCPAGYAFELVNRDKVFTYGVNAPTDEDDRITFRFQKAKSLLGRHMHLLENGGWKKLRDSERKKLANEVFNPYIDAREEYVEKVLQRRSKLFVENLFKAYSNWEKEGNKSKVIILIGGGEHYAREGCKNVADYLDELKQSYLVLKPNNYK